MRTAAIEFDLGIIGIWNCYVEWDTWKHDDGEPEIMIMCVRIIHDDMKVSDHDLSPLINQIPEAADTVVQGIKKFEAKERMHDDYDRAAMNCGD